MTATTFGRPVTLPKTFNVKLPQKIDDEFLQDFGEGFQPIGNFSKLEGFVYSIQLFDILDNVLTTIYASSNGEVAIENRNLGFAKKLAGTVMLNSQLDDLLRNTPAHLKLPVGDRRRNCFKYKRQNWVADMWLKLINIYTDNSANIPRILYIRLLILRPWLLEGLDPVEEKMDSPTLGQNTTHEIRAPCVSTAQLIIDTLHENEMNPYQSSNLHTIYCKNTSRFQNWTQQLISTVSYAAARGDAKHLNVVNFPHNYRAP